MASSKYAHSVVLEQIDGLNKQYINDKSWEEEVVWMLETFTDSSGQQLILLAAAHYAKTNPNVRNFYRKIPFKAELLRLICNKLCDMRLICDHGGQRRAQHTVEGLFLLMPSGMAMRGDLPSECVSEVLRTTMNLPDQRSKWMDCIQRMVCEQMQRCFGELFSPRFREVYEEVFPGCNSSVFLKDIFLKSIDASRKGVIRKRMNIDLINIIEYDMDGWDRDRSSGVHTFSTICSSFEDVCHTKLPETIQRMDAKDIVEKVKEKETAPNTVDRLTGHVLLTSAHGVDGSIEASDLLYVDLQVIIDEVSKKYPGLEKVIIVQACRDIMQESWNRSFGIKGRHKLIVPPDSNVHVVFTTAKGKTSFRNLFFQVLNKQMFQPENKEDFGLCLKATFTFLNGLGVYPEIIPPNFPSIPFVVHE